jgi:hypothetical protein
MPISDEHIPSAMLRDEIIAKAVLPQIAACAAEAGCPESFRGLVRVQKKDVTSFGAPDGFWTVRLIVRHTFNETRDVFQVQALVSKRGDTGFCGFQMRGEATRNGNSIDVAASTWTGLYNTTGNDDWS